MARVMSLDYGRKRIGLAVTDETQLFVRPLAQVDFNRKDSWEMLSSLIRANAPEKIVIGNPDCGEGVNESIRQEITDFRKHLEKLFPKITFFFFDEAYSSQEAELILSKGKPNHTRPQKNKANRKNLDSTAAAVILERYLEG